MLNSEEKDSIKQEQSVDVENIGRELRNNSRLIESMIESDTVALSVLRPVFGENGVEDFVWVMANKLLRAHANGINVVGKRYTEVFPSSITNGVLEGLKATYNSGNRSQDEIYLENNNIKAWLRQIYVRSQDYIILSAEDTTLTRKTDQLLAGNARLRSLVEAKTRFFNNASHEFRTPLTLILGPLQDVINNNTDKLSPEDSHRLQIVAKNVARLQKLVNTMLDFARMEAGKLDALFQPTDLGELTQELASNFREVIERAGLKFTCKIDSPMPKVYVNRDMWEKIVLNLLSNAFKFTHKGKIEISLRAKKKAVQLLVKDTGIGISSKNITRIFERFVRVEPAGGRTYEGTGIGLSLVKELVQLHGGNVKVKSTEGKGSIFSVTIKFGTSHLPPAQVIETKKDLATSDRHTFVEEATGWLPEPRMPGQRKKSGGSKTKFTVLVVDDNADMREYLASVLSANYHVISLENGKSAINFLHKGFYPDLVISDVMMPEIDGYDLVSFIKNTPSIAHVPVILLSARTGEDAAIEALGIGADDYIEKPFSSRQLLAYVKARITMTQRNLHLRGSLN